MLGEERGEGRRGHESSLGEFQVTSAAVSEVREMIRLMSTFNSQLLLFGDPSSKSSSAAAAKWFDESAVPVLSWRVSRVSIKILS
jgi:hypothetical protein